MSLLSTKAILFHQTPTKVIIGFSQAGNLLATHDIPYRDASAELVPAVDSMLASMSVNLSDISYIACNIGPAAFTTLRTVVVTANGLGFGANIPLVGVNSLICLMKEAHQPPHQRTYALVTAFGNDVYFGVYDPAAGLLECSLMPSQQALTAIISYARTQHNSQIHLVGSAVAAHQNALQAADVTFELPQDSATTASLMGIAHQAEQAWQSGHKTYELMPYYGQATSGAEKAA